MTEDINKKEPTHGDGHEGIPFFPLHMMKEIMVVIGIVIALSLLATFVPAGLEEAADSFKTPAHVKPEWYFLAIYQVLKYVPQGQIFEGLTFLNLAVVGQGLFVFVLFLIPFLDKSPHKLARKRPIFLALGIIAIVFMVVFTYLGHFSGFPDPIFGITVH